MPKNKTKEEIELLLKKPSKKKTIKEYQRIIDILYKELKRRDEVIDQLKHEKEILFNTSLKSNERLKDFQKIAEDKE